jgi:hypothetical protein
MGTFDHKLTGIADSEFYDAFTAGAGTGEVAEVEASDEP